LKISIARNKVLCSQSEIHKVEEKGDWLSRFIGK
jgi:hypothetical protein